MTAGALLLLDGPLGTELESRGLPLPAPLWSARALIEAPRLVSAIHADYAAAGAQVHTANTFRTTARALAGSEWAAHWRTLLEQAVAVCRDAVPPDARVAGSLAPLEDCYSPQLTPSDDALAREHADLATALAAAGCDLLLVETMPTLRELRAATAAAAATGLPVWAGITLGPAGDFFDEAGVEDAARATADAGAEAFVINCSEPRLTTRRLEALHPPSALRLGAYANTLFEGEDWPPERYADEARRWIAAGATLVGGCCGTGPEHIAALRRLASPPAPGIMSP